MIKKVQKTKDLAWGEAKQRFGWMLTPTGKELLKQKAKSAGVTGSEFLERLVRSVNPYNLESDGELSKNGTAKDNSWGEAKESFCSMICPLAKKILGIKAQKLGITESEFLERAIRNIEPATLREYSPERFGHLSLEDCIGYLIFQDE